MAERHDDAFSMAIDLYKSVAELEVHLRYVQTDLTDIKDRLKHAGNGMSSDDKKTWGEMMADYRRDQVRHSVVDIPRRLAIEGAAAFAVFGLVEALILHFLRL